MEMLRLACVQSTMTELNPRPLGAVRAGAKLPSLDWELGGTKLAVYISGSYHHYCSCYQPETPSMALKQCNLKTPQKHEWSFQNGFTFSLANGPSRDSIPAKS